MPAPLAPGSISLRLYPHLDRPAPEVVAELRAQAALAETAGWDGVMVSEHHGGFYGYLPNPLQLAGWLLDGTTTLWAAACPILLPLRPAVLVAEEAAWLAARFPGRVGLGVAAGGLPADFELLGVPQDDLARRFADGLRTVSDLLVRGTGLVDDPALAACASSPVPMVSAVASATAMQRAAANGVGVLFDSLTALDRCKELIDVYRDAGGDGPVILIRRAWLGEPPRAAYDAQVGVYQGYAGRAAKQHWGKDELVADDVAGTLASALEATGADALNIRITVPGVGPEQVRDQIEALGAEVLPKLR